MRLKINLRIDKLPIVYRHRIMSLLKEALDKSKIKDKYYNKNIKITKFFTFSLLYSEQNKVKKIIRIDENYEIQDFVFYINDKDVYLFVSSPDIEFLSYIYNGLLDLKGKNFNFSTDHEMLIRENESYNKISFVINNIYLLKSGNEVKKEEVFLKTKSPILLSDIYKKNPILPKHVMGGNNKNSIYLDTVEYSKQLNIVNLKKLRYFYKDNNINEQIEFIPINLKKSVIKHTLKGFREKTNKPVMYLTGISGIFKLRCNNIDVLNTLVQMGLGVRTGQGFGMVEVLK